MAIANYYDELCNTSNLADAQTPHEALATMFAKLRGKFDPKLLQVFVRCLGVYPPGTIVQLSNGGLGMVATINTAKPMKPTLVLYDANIPKEEAILVDMGREVEVNIAGSGDVAVNASELLKVGIAGSGSVSYLGNPRLESEIAGSGAITRAGS